MFSFETAELNVVFLFQAWPCNDIGPTEALILLCSYENRTRETLNPKKLEDGEVKLKDLLMEEDFKMACLVSTSLQ